MTNLFVFVIVLLILAKMVKEFAPQTKGWAGEQLLNTFLKAKLDRCVYTILHNIMLPTDDGATTQIDHVIVSRYGIFVIETKTYKGWIYGDAKQPKWTQVVYKRKSQFQNPLRQNYKHIATLSECTEIPQEYFKTIIAFSGEATFKTAMPEEVMLFRHVPAYIQTLSTTPIILDEQVSEVVEAIKAWDKHVGWQQRMSHVSNLKKTHAPQPSTPSPSKKAVAPTPITPSTQESEHSPSPSASTPPCPKCGSPMVLRTSKQTGSQFWGCPTFPKCRGVRQLQ